MTAKENSNIKIIKFYSIPPHIQTLCLLVGRIKKNHPLTKGLKYKHPPPPLLLILTFTHLETRHTLNFSPLAIVNVLELLVSVQDFPNMHLA